jgi:FkbM family methyltransferase
MAHSGVSGDDIVAGIEMLLGWTPDAALVDYHQKLGFADRVELGRYLISTDEFQRRHVVSPSALFLGDRVMARTHRGDIIYVLPSDLDLTPSMLRDGRHEPQVERVITASIRPGDIAIDVGANVGYHTLAIASGVGDEGRVHAFEANPTVAKLLQATLVVNRQTTFRGTGKVNLYNKAVCDRQGVLTLEQAPGHYGSGHLVTEVPGSDLGPEYSQRFEVEAVTLDDMFTDVPSIDFMHLDIEGAEPLAFRGAQKLLERSVDVRIVTEWSVHMMRSLSDLDAHIGRLMKLGFRFWQIGGESRLRPVAAADLVTLPHCDLFIARHEPPAI